MHILHITHTYITLCTIEAILFKVTDGARPSDYLVYFVYTLGMHDVTMTSTHSNDGNSFLSTSTKNWWLSAWLAFNRLEGSSVSSLSSRSRGTSGMVPDSFSLSLRRCCSLNLNFWNSGSLMTSGQSAGVGVPHKQLGNNRESMYF